MKCSDISISDISFTFRFVIDIDIQYQNLEIAHLYLYRNSNWFLSFCNLLFCWLNFFWTGQSICLFTCLSDYVHPDSWKIVDGSNFWYRFEINLPYVVLVTYVSLVLTDCKLETQGIPAISLSHLLETCVVWGGQILLQSSRMVHCGSTRTQNVHLWFPWNLAGVRRVLI